MSKKELQDYGVSHQSWEFEVIPLWWNAVHEHEAWALWDTLFGKKDAGEGTDQKIVLPQHGVYAIEGRHDAHPNPTILYIGECGADSGEHQGQVLKTRLKQSLGLFIYNEFDDDGTKYKEYSPVISDVTVRTAEIPDTDLIIRVERALIKAHLPPLNGHGLKKLLPDDEPSLLILNAGGKGRLLPTVSNVYYKKGPWEAL